MPGFLYQIENRQEELKKKVAGKKRTKPELVEKLPFNTEGLSRLEIQRKLKEQGNEKKAKLWSAKGNAVTATDSPAAVTKPEKKANGMTKVLAMATPVELHERLESYLTVAKEKKLPNSASKKSIALEALERGLALMESELHPAVKAEVKTDVEVAPAPAVPERLNEIRQSMLKGVAEALGDSLYSKPVIMSLSDKVCEADYGGGRQVSITWNADVIDVVCAPNALVARGIVPISYDEYYVTLNGSRDHWADYGVQVDP